MLVPQDFKGHPAVEAVAQGGWKSKSRQEIRSEGYVVSTLEAALGCVGATGSFKDALVLAANLGEDADTVGAVTGQFAGAIYRASRVRHRIESIARGLAQAAVANTRSP